MDYHLKPVGKTCAATGKDLVEGSRCFSALVEQNGELLRLDYSQEGWSGPPEQVIGYWQSVISRKTDSKPKKLDADALMRYFEQLCEDSNPAQEKFAYVLSLLLLQKRRLKIDGARQDGDIEYLELIGSRGEGPFEVRDQNLSDEEIAILQTSLNTHLAGEWA